MANGYGLWVRPPNIGAGSAVTNLYGTRIANQGNAGVPNAYGLYIDAQSGSPTTNTGLYNAGTSTFADTVTAQNGINVTGGALTGNGSVPIGGNTNQVLSKNSATNYDTSWKTSAGLPTGGTAGQALIKNSVTDFDASWATVTGGTGGGTVTSFSAGALSPLFTTTVATATTTPALSFVLSNAAAGTVFANNTASSGAPNFVTNPRISAIANLTGNGFVKTSGGIGTLGIDSTAYEPFLGNPSTDGYVLSSTTSGTRSWIAPLSAPVSSVFGRTGAVVAAANDYTFAQIGSKPTTLAGYGITDAQPLDSDLTAIAGLATTSFGRGFLTQADAAAARTYIGAGTSSFDGTWTSLTGKPTTLAGYGITDAQPLDADLTTWATKTPYAGTLTITTAKTLNATNTLTLSGTDGSTLNIGAGGTLGSAAYTGSTAYEVPLTFSQSLARATNTVTLSGDTASPGNSKFYGTNASGTRGWQSEPAYASLQTTPATPPTTASSGGVMAGLAGLITPSATGKIVVNIAGYMANNTANQAAFAQIRYGTGTAPTSGGGTTGTAIGSLLYRGGGGWTANATAPFTCVAIITGLSVGTQIWLDLSIGTLTSGTASYSNVCVTAFEIP
jgi:hypothetical protein